jgi:opacity protein-like surface antigen
MKKVTLFILLFAFVVSVNAQEFRLGAKAGLDVAMITVETGQGQANAGGSETGFYAGIFGELELSDQYTIQVEGLYSGVKNYGSIALPLSLERNFSEKWAAQAGLQGNLILDDLGEDVNSFSLGLLIGTSFNINEDIVIEGKYVYGLTSLVEDTDLRLSYLQIGVGYRFL